MPCEARAPEMPAKKSGALLAVGSHAVAGGQATRSLGDAQFRAAEGTHVYRLQGESIVLRQHPEVFPPSAFGLNFAERIDFSGRRRAADIGTGSSLPVDRYFTHQFVGDMNGIDVKGVIARAGAFRA